MKGSIEKKNQNINKIEKNKKEIENLETELQKYQNDIENLEKENQQFEKDLDISKYQNLVNSLNTMNDFYENIQKNGKISDEIKLTKDQINALKAKEHVLQYIRDNNNAEEEKTNSNNNNDNGFMNMNMFNKNEELTSDLFSGLNMNFNNNNEQKESGEEAGYTGFNLMIDNNNNGNDEDSNIDEKIKELEEKIQKASDVSLYIF